MVGAQVIVFWQTPFVLVFRDFATLWNYTKSVFTEIDD
jgi:hypothetical protein